MGEKLNPEQTAKATEEFLSSVFYTRLLAAYLDERKLDFIHESDTLIAQDAPKTKFSVLSGRRQELADLMEQIELWAARNKKPKSKESREGE